MLKKILESTEGLHEEVAKLYSKKDDGKFHLGLENDDAEPLRRAKEHEVGLRQIAERDRDQAKADLAAALTKVGELEKSLSKDTTELRADHELQMANLKKTHGQELEGLNGIISKIYITGVADRIAKEIAVDEGAAELLSESLARRLKVEMVNGQPVTRVLGLDGSASNASPDDLKSEYLQTAKFAGILRASEASGGGASGGSGGSGASNKKLKDMGDAERDHLRKTNPGEFKRLQDEYVAESN